jgi:hypothetical protein
MSVKHAQNADRRRKDFVIHRVRKAPHEHATELASNERVTKWSFLDRGHRFVNRVEKLLSSGRGSIEIPVKSGDNLVARDLANTEPTHLRGLLSETGLDVRPSIARFRRRVCLCLTPIQFRGHMRRDRSGEGRIETLPESPHQLNPLVGSQVIQ